MNKPVFLLEGNGCVLNRGCEAILRSTIGILERQFGPSEFISAPFAAEVAVDARVVPLSNLTHRLPAGRWSPRWVHRQISSRLFGRHHYGFEPLHKKSTAVLAIGGDNFSLDYGPNSARTHLEAAHCVLDAGRPIAIWGGSVGPFSADREFEKWAAEMLRPITLICARESETVAYLEGIGIKENVRLVSDPAFTLETTAVELADNEKMILKGGYLGLNLSPLMRRYWKGAESWQAAAAKCVKQLLEAVDAPVALIPHVTDLPDNDDYVFLRGISDQLPEYRDRLLLVGSGYNCCQLKWIISHLRGFIGARTHATIAAMSSYVPTVCIGYSMKARGISKDLFGHTQWLLPLEDFSGRQLIESAGRLLDAETKVRSHLQSVIPDHRARALLAAEYLREAVGLENIA